MPFKFENLKVWQLSLDLADNIHLVTRTFPKEELYSLTQQIKRAADSINLNIADINVQERLLFILKAKGNKQRLVPIASKHLQDISDYIKEGREWFLQYHTVHREHQNKNHGKPRCY